MKLTRHHSNFYYYDNGQFENVEPFDDIGDMFSKINSLTWFYIYWWSWWNVLGFVWLLRCLKVLLHHFHMLVSVGLMVRLNPRPASIFSPDKDTKTDKAYCKRNDESCLQDHSLHVRLVCIRSIRNCNFSSVGHCKFVNSKAMACWNVFIANFIRIWGLRSWING